MPLLVIAIVVQAVLFTFCVMGYRRTTGETNPSCHCPSCCSMPPAAVARPRRCDAAGVPRRPAGAQQGMRYPADPPTIEEIVT
jgi:hypothetical protein